MLTKVKDTLPLGKQSNVVYRIPCSCSHVYIRKTKWRLETRVKEHWDACKRGMMEKSAVAEQAWENRCWTMAEDRSSWWRRPTTSRWQRFNRDGGLEIAGCWAAVIRRQGEWSNPQWPLTSNDVYPQQCMAINNNVCLHLFTFALMTTGPFSQNIGKLFSELKIYSLVLSSDLYHSE